ncbi:FAD-dependent oxidoreductase [Rhodococcus erythropolis]|uniref:FAD-dependent oxidoreductase n=1 Tax=Rhodococcus erythropolis TaxID=1833 RepID=A0A0C3ABP1_RHOER|nr:FAD-dependent oxidoreductase [Rhodococcus erythropolis]KIM17494.1 FAD-dependent oxidoreductase [Rhodococcus erythropolis]
MSAAIVVGSGPNGLAAAAHLAMSGVSVTVYEAAPTIGGGTRTSELTVPGVLHDDCSAVHQVAAGSPFFNSLDLSSHGLRWLRPEIDLAHPMDSGAAAVLHRSVEATSDGLRGDGKAWQRLFGPLTAQFDNLAADFLRPIVHLPEHPITLTRFGLNALLPATVAARRFDGEQGRALFAGIAAHSMYPLTRPMTSAIALMLIAAGHKYGWVVAEGGSKSITDALASIVTSHGGIIETGVRVTDLRDLPPADIVMLDLSPTAVAEIAGSALPARVGRAYRRWRYGPGAYKIDLAIEGDLPWIDDACKRAGTVHLGGNFEEIVAGERLIHRGAMPERPFVLVGQQYLADPSRSNGNINPIWAYAHVPHGYTGDATEAILDQIDRFAPGVRDRIVGQFVRNTTEMYRYNVNYVGGDIITGANDPLQIVGRPRFALDPYFTGMPGVYICSAATPPGAGAHGMGGYNAACSALRALRR